MKFSLFLGLIYGLIVLNKAAVMGGVYKNPNHPDKCIVGDIVMSPGEVILNPSKYCRRMICGENSWVVFHTCGAILPPEGYKLGEPIDPTAPYPKCCEKHYIPIEQLIEIK